jgi:ubiquinone/menaquinone biosynthesis C-methylase UbiE
MRKIKEVYRDYSRSYDLLSNYASCYQNLKSAHLNKIIKSTSKGDLILDFGCGTGNITLPLLKKKRDVVAIDISEDMLNLLKEKCNGLKGLRVIRGDLASSNFPRVNKKIKVITLMNVFYHLENSSEYIKKFYDLLEDKGILIVSGPIKNISAIKLFKEIKKDLKKKKVFEKYKKEYRIVYEINKDKLIPNAKLYSKSTLKTLFEKEGFKMISFSDRFYYGNNYLAIFNKSAPKNILLEKEAKLR